MAQLYQTMIFVDRKEAGIQLAEPLLQYRNENPIVLALPRGGVPVGYEVAYALGAELDVIVARKIGAPFQPEYGIGAIAPGGVRVLDEASVRILRISESYIEKVVAEETVELERRIRRYRGDRPPPVVEGRTVLLVDDGIATGRTAQAAILSLRKQNPRRMVLAAPVCAQETANELRRLVEDAVFLMTPVFFEAVGRWYDDFRQVSDEEVVALLERARNRMQTSLFPPPAPATLRMN